MDNENEIGKDLIATDSKNLVNIGRMNTNTQDFLSKINEVLLMKLPNHKALAIMKEQTASAEEEGKEHTEAELERDIAKHFQATYIAPTQYVPDTYYVRSSQGHFIVNKSKEVIIGPVKFIGGGSHIDYNYGIPFLSSTYVDKDGNKHLFCFDSNGNSLSLPKQNHYQHFKPVNNHSNIFIINIHGDAIWESTEHGSSSCTPIYEHLIDRMGKRISQPYKYINQNLIASMDEKTSHNVTHNRYTKLVEKNGEYVELAPRCNRVITFESGEFLFIYNKENENYYCLYNNENKLVKKMDIVDIASNGRQSPYVGKDETGFKIIYEGKIYDIPTIKEIFPVAEDFDSRYNCTDHRHDSLYMKDSNDKLILWEKGEIIDLEKAPKDFVNDIFYGQAKLYTVDDNKSILTDVDGKVIDVGDYKLHYQSQKENFAFRNQFIVKRPTSAEKYSKKRQIISYTGAVSEVYDEILDNEAIDVRLIKQTGYIKVKLEEKRLLVDIKTCKPAIEPCDELEHFRTGHIYVRHITSPRPDYNQDAYLLDKNLTPVLGPVYEIKLHANLIRVTTHESLEMISCTPDRKYPIDNCTYYFPDLTPVGK